MRRQPVTVTDLAAMATCEQRVAFIHRLGKRTTAEQQRAVDNGVHVHTQHDRKVHYLYTTDPIWWSIAAGVVAGIPLSLIGELLCTGTNGSIWWRVLGLVMTAPGAAYSAITGQSVFATLTSMIVYFIAQIVFYTVIALLISVFLLSPVKTAGRNP